MTIQSPSLRTIAICAVASCAVSSCLSAFFGLVWSGMTAFLCCTLLLLSAYILHPTQRETIACGISGSIFGIMYTFGHSYDTINSYGLIFKNGRSLITSMLAMLSLALIAACICLILFRLLDCMRTSCLRTDKGNAKERRLIFFLSAIMIFLGSVPYLLLYAPGLNIFDTHDQILQFFGYPSYIGDGSALSDHHPVFLTILYAAFMKLGLLLGSANTGQMIYSLASMTALSCAWAYALCTLYDEGLAKKVVLSIAAFVSVYPVLALYAFNMCKDISAAPFVLIFVAQMIRLHRTDGQAIRSKKYFVAMFFNSLMLMLMRKPSLYALAFAAVFSVIAYRGVRVRLGMCLFGAILFFHIGYSSLLLPALGVIPGETREMLSIPFQMTARYLNTYPNDVSPEELKAVSRILDLEAMENYNPRLSDPIKDTSNPDMNGEDLIAYLCSFVKMGLRHPGVYIDAWLNMIYGYFYPSDSNTIFCLTLNSPDQGKLILTQNEKLDAARLELHNIFYFRLRRIPGVGCLFYVSTVSWAFLLLLCYAVTRGGLKESTPWMFFFGTLGICLLSPKSGEIRYLMPILYALPVMLGVLLLPAKKGEYA